MKSKPLSEVQYIELLIESEKSQGKPGFMRHIIQSLEACKKEAELLAKTRTRWHAFTCFTGNPLYYKVIDGLKFSSYRPVDDVGYNILLSQSCILHIHKGS